MQAQNIYFKSSTRACLYACTCLQFQSWMNSNRTVLWCVFVLQTFRIWLTWSHLVFSPSFVTWVQVTSDHAHHVCSLQNVCLYERDRDMWERERERERARYTERVCIYALCISINLYIRIVFTSVKRTCKRWNRFHVRENAPAYYTIAAKTQRRCMFS